MSNSTNPVDGSNANHPKSDDPKNRRKRLRYSANIKVEMVVSNLEEPRAERTANISRDGLFVVTEYNGKIGDFAHLRVIFKEEEAFFDVRGRVCWVSDGSEYVKGLGFEFTDLTDKHHRVIDEYLSRYINVKSTVPGK